MLINGICGRFKVLASISSASAATLDTLLLQLMKAVKPAIKAKVAAEAEEALAKTLNLPQMPFISMTAAPAS